MSRKREPDPGGQPSPSAAAGDPNRRAGRPAHPSQSLSGLSPFSVLLRRELQQVGGEGIFDQLRLESLWPDLVGERVAEHTRPLQLRNGTLVVGVLSPAWHNTLKAMMPLLLSKLRERCPDLPIERVRLQLGDPERRPKSPAPAPPALELLPLSATTERSIERTAARVEDPELRKRLAALMHSERMLRQERLRRGWHADPQTGDLTPPEAAEPGP